MNCIIIDDEPLAQEILEDYILKVPYLHLVGKCSSAFEAFEVLRQNPVDLIFLDIHMPNVSGIDFLNSLDNKPMFIFTTAYSEHALEGFNLNALDYLLKPIPFDRFLKAVNKACDLYAFKQSKHPSPFPSGEENQAGERFILVKSGYKSVKIMLNEIRYIEGLKDYVKIFKDGATKPVITLNSLKNLDDKLPSELFVRIHKSYIISLRHIQSVTRNRVVIGETWLPLGENYRDLFLETLKKQNISL